MTNEEQVTCPDCYGNGEFYTSHTVRCYLCHGKGSVTREVAEAYDATIKRVQQKQEIRDYISENLTFMPDEVLHDIQSIIKENRK